jgi:hypothetical protein
MKSHPSRSQALLRRTLNAGLLRVRHAITRATRYAAAFLAGDAGSLLGDCPWTDGGTYIYYDSGNVGIGATSPLTN